MRPNHHTATASIPPLVSASPGFGPWLPAFVLLAVLWELLARWQDNDLLLPTFGATARALV
jgi:ABC-type nitrate/sulfonate/bicarbonate transport system permease component